MLKNPLLSKASILLLLVIGIGLTLRLIAITWGLPTDTLPLEPLHPDEKWMMQVFSQMNWSLGDFNPDMGHREGTFSYYLWATFAFLLKQLGILKAMHWELPRYDSNYGNFILACRSLTTLLDIGSILLVYFFIKKTIKNEWAAILGALLLAVTPFEVIHSHYARTHIMANFFLMCVIAVSTRIYDRDKWLDYIFIGFLCGVCFATRYPVGVSAVIPVVALALKVFFKENSLNQSAQIVPALKIFIPRAALITLFTLIGFFICDPYLFLDFESARPHLLEQASFIDKKEFGLATLLNLDKIITYITYLFPYGTYPSLWILYYFAPLYLLFRPKLYRYTLPLMIYTAIYFYSMAKGYTTELIFIRPTLAIFPSLAILSAIAVWDVWLNIPFRAVRAILALAVFCIVSLAAIYSYSYVTAMTRPDPRVRLFNYLKKKSRNKAKVEVCAFPYVRNFIVMSPALDAVKNPAITFVTREDIGENPAGCDFLVIPAYEPGQLEQANIRVNAALIAGTFSLVKKIENPITFGGYVFSNENYPHDLQYPFPVLFLLKRKI